MRGSVSRDKQETLWLVGYGWMVLCQQRDRPHANHVLESVKEVFWVLQRRDLGSVGQLFLVLQRNVCGVVLWVLLATVFVESFKELSWVWGPSRKSLGSGRLQEP